MNLLAIDTATERCSVAVRVDDRWCERSVDTQRGHADIVLTMVDEVLQESGVQLRDLVGIAYGRGPGAFTGVRIAIGVVQGLAYGAQLPTVGVSNLAAVAQQVRDEGDPILACMDARMNEVYWAVYERSGSAVRLAAGSSEQVAPPSSVSVDPNVVAIVAGTGSAAYDDIARRYVAARHINVLPRARDILVLAEQDLIAGRGRPAIEAQPVYLRDQVTFVKPA
jgi:tRNA threonylcarbamoyladenosine biosynthesis protein TsaB